MAKKLLTENQAEEIRIDIRDGISFSDIAGEWGVSETLIRRINSGVKYQLDGYIYPIRPIKKNNE